MVHTETGPNLAGARAAIEALMDDVCVIVRDPGGRENAAVDLTTGRLLNDGLDVVYVGRCKVREINTVSNTRPIQEGGETVRATDWAGAIPLDGPTPEAGDLLIVTDSRRDPKLIGREYRITDVKGGTFAVQRSFSLEFRRYVSETPDGPVTIPVEGPPDVVIVGPQGPQGETGPQGPEGPPGAGGNDVAYVHEQLAPATSWPINHDLGKFPSVHVIDSGGTEIEVQVDYVDDDNLTVIIAYAITGKAYLN